MNMSTLKHTVIAFAIAIAGAAAPFVQSRAADKGDVPLIEGLIESVDYQLNLLVVDGITYQYMPRTDIIVRGSGKTVESSLQIGLPVQLIIETEKQGDSASNIRLGQIIILGSSTTSNQDN